MSDVIVDKKVIILNKPFLGGYLDEKGNIGHEIIDFLRTDSGEYYIYNNPWGVCPDNIWIDGTKDLTRSPKEKYVGKYLVLTGKEKNQDFNILYVIELEEKLHRYHTSKSEKTNDKFSENQESVRQIIRDRNIYYNGKLLDEIYKDDKTFYLTFKGKRIYKAEEPIAVTGLTYNFQRNKGYIYSDKNVSDYDTIESLIYSSITNGKLVEFEPRTVNPNTIGNLHANETFLDLIAMQDNEQVFTNMLHSILSYKNLINEFCLRFKGDKNFDNCAKYDVSREAKVEDGRMDVSADSEKQRVIIENKVYSGLNGIKSSIRETQLSTYYKWGKERDLEPLCFVIAPNFRLSEIKTEIEELDPRMTNVYEVYSYGEVAAFIDEQYKNGNLDSQYEFYNLVPQIINAFKNLSYSTKEDLYARKFLNATKDLKI